MNPSEEATELVAGQVVPPGCYARVDVRSGRLIILESGGPLPASLDGKVAVYEPLARLTREAIGAASGGRSVVALD